MMLKITVLLMLAELVASQKPVLQLCSKPMTGMKCMMMCDLSESEDKTVKVMRNTAEIATCLNQTSCEINDPEHKRKGATVSWDSHGNKTMIHLMIMSLDLDTDMGKWSCSYDDVSSDEKNLKITSKPSSINLEQMNETLECQVDCVFPDSDVSAQLFVNNEPTKSTETRTDGDSSSCKSTKEKSVIFVWSEKFSTENDYRCEVTMAAVSWSGSSSIKKANVPNGPPVTTIVAIVIVVVFVILAVVIAVILIRKRRNAKGGAQLAKSEPEGEREEL